MERVQKNERIAAMVKILSDSPGKVFTLGFFTDMFGAAKSTISEDIDSIQALLERFELGKLETMSGASGGMRFVPLMSNESTDRLLKELCERLSIRSRILPGGYLYMLDIIYDPKIITEIGRVFAARFFGMQVDYVATVETKGIPLAFTTARLLNVPLVIARHNSEATDGPSVNINYVSGSSKKIQTMVLPLKSLKRNSKLLFIDDFMKGGGTAKGIIELAREFECEVSGIGVIIETSDPPKKRVDGFFSLLTLRGVDEENGAIDIKPSKELK